MMPPQAHWFLLLQTANATMMVRNKKSHNRSRRRHSHQGVSCWWFCVFFLVVLTTTHSFLLGTTTPTRIRPIPSQSSSSSSSGGNSGRFLLWNSVLLQRKRDCRSSVGHVARLASSANKQAEYNESRTFREAPLPIFQRLLATSTAADDRHIDVLRLQDLTQWDELRDLLDDEDLTQAELEDMVATILSMKSEGGATMEGLDQAGFCLLYKQIDDLFLYDDDDDDDDADADEATSTATTGTALPDNPTSTKDQKSLSSEPEFLSLLKEISNGDSIDQNKLPCGMDCTDKEQELIAAVVSELLEEGNASNNKNLVWQNNGNVLAKDVIGDWSLLYTSSKAMIKNKSLSGLVGIPGQKADFSGVRQIFTGSKFLGFVEYVETFNAGTDESFEVIITGEWELKQIREAFTGQPATAIKMDPNKIEYSSAVSGMTEEAPMVQLGGGLSQGASWQSLGPIKLLDVIYLTTDLMISRGNSNLDAIFVWTKNEGQ